MFKPSCTPYLTGSLGFYKSFSGILKNIVFNHPKDTSVTSLHFRDIYIYILFQTRSEVSVITKNRRGHCNFLINILIFPCSYGTYTL